MRCATRNSKANKEVIASIQVMWDRDSAEKLDQKKKKSGRAFCETSLKPALSGLGAQHLLFCPARRVGGASAHFLILLGMPY